MRQFLGRARAEPQPDRVGATGGDAATDDEGVALQRVKGLRPGFPAMDVGAVSEMEAVVEFHAVVAGTALRAVRADGSASRPCLDFKLRALR